MPDPIILFAVAIGLAGAVITALPLIAWLRRRARRKEALARFLEEAGDVRELRYRRTKTPEAPGFADIYEGRTKGFAFSLAYRIIPFRAVRPFWLTLETESSETKAVHRWAITADPEGDEPIARIAAMMMYRRSLRQARKEHANGAKVISIVLPPN